MDIYLVNANAWDSGIKPGADNAGLLYTWYGLKSAGFKSRLLPETNISNDTDWLYEDITQEISDKILNTDELKLIGISSMTQSVPYRNVIANSIKSNLKNTCVVFGGPHATKSQNTKDEFLGSSLFDAYNLGGSQPFISLCQGLESGEITFADKTFKGTLPEGIYYRLGTDIAGREIGKFPEINASKIDEVVYNMSGTFNYPRIPIHSTDECPNNCGYCSSPKTVAPDINAILGIVELSLQNPVTRYHPIALDFTGNNPFMRGKNRKNTEDLLENICGYVAKSKTRALYTFFLDPSILIDDREYMTERTSRINGLVSYFIGRDYPDGDLAAKFGRKWHGKPRSQERLDSEIDGIAKFLKDITEIRRGVTLYLSYIFPPGSDDAVFKTVANEMIYFSAIGKKLKPSIGIDFRINSLTPYPDTEVYYKYRGRFDESAYFKYNVGNAWLDEPALDNLETSLRVFNILGSSELKEEYQIFMENNSLKIAAVLFPAFMKGTKPNPRITKSKTGLLDKLARQVHSRVDEVSKHDLDELVYDDVLKKSLLKSSDWLEV